MTDSSITWAVLKQVVNSPHSLGRMDAIRAAVADHEMALYREKLASGPRHFFVRFVASTWALVTGNGRA